MVLRQKTVPLDPIVITGIGLVTPLGQDRESSWQGIRSGRSGLCHVTLRDGARVVGGAVALDVADGPRRVHEMAQRACDEAIRDARLDLSRLDRDRAGCVIG